MKSPYELIDLVSGNLADLYPDLAQALTVLTQLLNEHGSAELMDYGLLEIRENGELGESWSEDALLEKVKAFAIDSTVLSRTT